MPIPGKLGPLALRDLVAVDRRRVGQYHGLDHRHKTFGHLQARQPVPGVFFWRSRHGWAWLVTNTGTHPLGRGPAVDALWQAAAPRAVPPSPRTVPGPKTRSHRRYRTDIIRPEAGTQLIMRT